MRHINDAFKGIWSGSRVMRNFVGMSDEGDDTNWLDVLQTTIQTAGNVVVANRGGVVRTVPSAIPGARPTVTMSGSSGLGIGAMSTTTLMLIGGGVLAAYLLLRKR